MTITTKYQVEETQELYDTEQQAQIAEVLSEIPSVYLTSYQVEAIAKAFEGRYFLVPIIPTETIRMTEEEFQQLEIAQQP